MLNQFSRTELLLGREGMERLSRARVAVFGIGGVGGYAVEALARSGVGALDLIDDDRVSLSNLNRQISATQQTIGQYKVDAARQRIEEINPDCRVTVYKTFFTPETAGQFNFSDYDYIIDAIDTVTGKLSLAEQAVRTGVPIISSMGAGNKLDPTALEVADISQTSVCPLARVMRKELKKRGIYHLKVVYSREPPLTPLEVGESDEAAEQPNRSGTPSRRQTPGSNALVPAAAGLIAAGEVIRALSGFERQTT
ncbi:MAG: tRNA threonylcarbamoyladenosine dehydratase [Clostridiales bacterium]|nr:tRNA threonylcarbamoyladenosine dehydratase [Clostridiales bacterium]